MIDYFALALGHGLLALALLRLVMRNGLDADPLIGAIKDETETNRKAAGVAGRNAARRAQTDDNGEGDGEIPRLRSATITRKKRAAVAKR